jgi:hypothetical protein
VGVLHFGACRYWDPGRTRVTVDVHNLRNIETELRLGFPSAIRATGDAMTHKSRSFSDKGPEVVHDCHLDLGTFPSGVVLKASAIAPRDIIDRLPEELLHWLHEGSYQESGPRSLLHRASGIDFESIIVDRLFPLRDPREFVVHLRSHCQVTAIAAGMLAESSGQSRGLAYACGWLHDMGIAACVRHIDDAASAVDDAALVRLWPMISRSSAQHGIRLASQWRLPSAIRHAIRDYATFASLLPANPLVANIVIAEHIAASLGHAFHERASVVTLSRALSILGIQEAAVGVAAAKVERSIRRMDLCGVRLQSAASGH